MPWRELQQHGDQALQKSNKRWFVLGRRPKDHNSRMGFWRVCLNIREIQVQRHQHAIFRTTTLRESTESAAPESFSSETVSASKPDPRRIDAYSVGRFSSTLNFKLLFPAANQRCPRASTQPHTPMPHRYPGPSVLRSSAISLRAVHLPQHCPL
jgi:hypothetical protein